ncbi:HNH endonuclease [Tenacibaculum halocynthiae]|uniref:HNH endonuclease n=1 Tax=Tenacibaculum halocynthiae TaxID=1254437 RepID=UPI003D645EFE
MIKIQEHLNRPDADAYLDNLALKMWSNLNKKRNIDNEYYKSSLIKKLDKLRLKLEEDDYLETYANNSLGKFQRQKKFITYLHANEYTKLKELVISKPDKLVILKQEILGYLQQDDLSVINNGKVKQTSFGELLITNLFNYNSFRQSKLCFQLLIEANLKNSTCPYCNENDIRVIDISEEGNEEKINKAYLDLDHFYPKSQHPYFALSYYNLIPCCHICNSSEKGDKNFSIETHQQPFYESLNDNYKFKISSKSVINGTTDYLKLIKRADYRDDFSDRDLRLSYRYNTHLNAANEFIKHYLNYYKSSPPRNLDWKEVILKDVPLEVHQILSKKLGKMYKDIFEQIKID